MAQFGASAEDEDPSVCYRHPGRTSWILCQRCGRTICPECQIPAAVGVQCPDCVRESGATPPRTATVTSISTARRRAPRRDAGERPRWLQNIGRMLNPGSTAPVLTWGFVVLALAIWLVGGVVQVLPAYLYASTDTAIQVWRFVTAGAVLAPLSGGLSSVISALLSIVFFLLVAPAAEVSLGRARFAAIALSSGVVGTAAMLLTGGVAFGTTAILFGLFGAMLVLQWDYPQARIQWFIWMGINFVLSITIGSGFWLPYILGGVLTGIGTTLLLQRYEANARSSSSTAYLIIAGGAAAFVVLAVLRSILA